MFVFIYRIHLNYTLSSVLSVDSNRFFSPVICIMLIWRRRKRRRKNRNVLLQFKKNIIYHSILLLGLTSKSGLLDIAFSRIIFSRVYKKTLGMLTSSTPSPDIANIGWSSALEPGMLSTTYERKSQLSYSFKYVLVCIFEIYNNRSSPSLLTFPSLVNECTIATFYN